VNFYKRHIGDYIKDAAHLSLLEHGVYARLLDVYYARESGIPDGQAARLIGARSKEEQQAVKTVLDEFFHLVDGVWTQKRCEAEIQAANLQGEANRLNGMKGGRPPKTKPKEKPIGFPSGSDSDNEKTLIQTPDSISKDPPYPPRGGETLADNKTAKPKRTAIGLLSFLQSCKKSGTKPISEDDPVFAYADQAGIPQQFLHLHWLEFKARYGQPDAKRYRDWAAVHLKSVRGNWFRLWFIDAQGNVMLTTVGEQAKRVHGEAA